MTRSVGSRTQIPLLIGALAMAAACTFEPPGSVLDNTVAPRPDAGPGGGAPDAEPGGGGGTETLTFTYTSSPTGVAGNYEPANVVATWIEDSAGTPVATINRQAGQRITSLEGWILKVGAGNADAVTGATRATHNTPVVVTWAIPADLANGIYTIRVETSDANPDDITPADNNQGEFTFDKNGTASSNAGIAGNGYTNITIDYAVPTL